jgi:hypothetical protein
MTTVAIKPEASSGYIIKPPRKSICTDSTTGSPLATNDGPQKTNSYQFLFFYCNSVAINLQSMQ